jgi:hypothetical protein
MVRRLAPWSRRLGCSDFFLLSSTTRDGFPSTLTKFATTQTYQTTFCSSIFGDVFPQRPITENVKAFKLFRTIYYGFQALPQSWKMWMKLRGKLVYITFWNLTNALRLATF